MGSRPGSLILRHPDGSFSRLRRDGKEYTRMFYNFDANIPSRLTSYPLSIDPTGLWSPRKAAAMLMIINPEAASYGVRFVTMTVNRLDSGAPDRVMLVGRCIYCGSLIEEHATWFGNCRTCDNNRVMNAMEKRQYLTKVQNRRLGFIAALRDYWRVEIKRLR